jgi:phosphonoacetate hydrolase
VLGKSRSAHDLGALHGALRSHGGLHEQTVPMIFTHPLREGALRGRELWGRDLHDLLLNALA